MRTVIGVVANVKQNSLREEPAPEMYVPFTQNEIKIWPPMQTMHQGGVFTTRTLERSGEEARELLKINAKTLKALGMTRRQGWAAVAWQTTLTLLIAVLVGAPLGVAAGRAGWRGFADSLGVVPSTEIPLLTLIAGLLALVVAGNLLASVPAAIAARTRAALFLRAD